MFESQFTLVANAYSKQTFQLRPLNDDQDKAEDREKLLGYLAFADPSVIYQKDPAQADEYRGAHVGSERSRLIDILPKFDSFDQLVETPPE